MPVLMVLIESEICSKFVIDKLKTYQKENIDALLHSKDVFVLQKTDRITHGFQHQITYKIPIFPNLHTEKATRHAIGFWEWAHYA